MLTTKERQFWLEFLKLYKSKPELWKIKSEEYKDRAKKEEAYQALADKCKEVEPFADKDYVTKKINSFRSVYRRELKKIKKSLKLGEEEYISSVWYFKAIDFLKDQEGFLEGESKERDSGSEHNEEENQKDASAIKLQKKHKSVSSDEILELAAKRLKSSDDYSQTLANVWAKEYRLATDEQKFYAKKAIDDILFEARLGTLHRNSIRINQGPEPYYTADIAPSSWRDQNNYSQYNRPHVLSHSSRPSATTHHHSIVTLKNEASNDIHLECSPLSPHSILPNSEDTISISVEPQIHMH